MEQDPVRLADTREWLQRAADDLRGADIDLQATPPLIRDILFHSQQAVEKALKALLTWHDKPFRKTHELRDLGELCIAIDASLQTALEPAFALTEYAWRFRYPGAPVEPTLDEAQAAVALAHRVADSVFSRLPSDIRP